MIVRGILMKTMLRALERHNTYMYSAYWKLGTCWNQSFVCVNLGSLHKSVR